MDLFLDRDTAYKATAWTQKAQLQINLSIQNQSVLNQKQMMVGCTIL